MSVRVSPLATGSEAVAAEAGIDRRHVVAGVERARALGAVGRRRLGHHSGRRGGDRPRRLDRVRVGDVEDRHGHVVVGDELALPHAQAAAGVDARPVTRGLPALGRLLGERSVGDRDRVEVGHRVRDRLPVGEPAATLVGAGALTGEPEHVGVVRVHVQRTALRVQRVATAAAGRPLEDPVDPERLTTGRGVGLVDRLQHVDARVEGHRRVGDGIVGSRVHRRPGVDGRRYVRLLRGRGFSHSQREHEARRERAGEPTADGWRIHVLPP